MNNQQYEYNEFLTRVQETKIRIDVILNSLEVHTNDLFENFKITETKNINVDLIDFKIEYLQKLLLLEINLMSLAGECFSIHPHAMFQIKNVNQLLLKVVSEILNTQNDLECLTAI